MTISDLKEMDERLYKEIKQTLRNKVFDRTSKISEPDYRKFESCEGNIRMKGNSIYINIPYAEREDRDIKLSGMWLNNYNESDFGEKASQF